MCHRTGKAGRIRSAVKGRAKPEASGTVAKERLKLMIEAEKHRLDDDTLGQIRREISSVITKYVDIEPENIEVRVTLKDYQKRA